MVITRYNESLVDPRAVNLTNSIGTVDIEVPVGFSYPTGSFRLSEPNNIEFTHFSASIPSAGGTRFFKITNLTCINSKVTEYYYDIDYLKDYWMRFSGGSPTLSLPNTLLMSLYTTFGTEILSKTTMPVDEKLTSMVFTNYINEGTKLEVAKPYVVLNLGTTQIQGDITRNALVTDSGVPLACKTIYRFKDAVGMDIFNQKMMRIDPNLTFGETLNSLFSNIAKAFYAPATYHSADPLDPIAQRTLPTVEQLSVGDAIPYIDNDGDVEDGFTVTQYMHDSMEISYIRLPTNNGIIEEIIDTGLDILINNANDLPPYKKYRVYVPYIGWYDIPVNEIASMILMVPTLTRLYVKYYYNLIEGTVACRFGIGTPTGSAVPISPVWSAYITPYTPLPIAPVFTSNYASSAIAAENSLHTAVESNTISSLSSMAGHALSLNIGGLATDVAGMFVQQNQREIAHEQALANADLGSFTSGRDSNIGQVDRVFKLHTIVYHTMLSYDEAVKLYGYPVYSYINQISLLNADPEATENNKAWLDVKTSKFIGPKWYTDKVREEFGNNYITYITTTP